MKVYKLIGTSTMTAVLLASCGASKTASGNVSTLPASKPLDIGGVVRVAYAGSLVGAMVEKIAPAFQAQDGVAFSGLPGGSTGLVNQIKSNTTAIDVFISAAPSANDPLMGSANGNYASWYATLGSAPLVIGYNPSSKFSSDLKTKPWYQVMQEPGFLLGRTDPKIDPKGVLVEKLLSLEGSKLGDKNLSQAILGAPENPSQVFPEETLVARLQTGQLDAGFFYSNEAALAHIPTVSTGIALGATFTVTILNIAKDQKQAVAFVNFLYSPLGARLLSSVGISPSRSVVVGDKSKEPSGVLLG